MPTKSIRTLAVILLYVVTVPLSQWVFADAPVSPSAQHPATAVAVRAYEEFFGITGGAVAVLRGEDVLYRETFGFANVEFNVPVTSDTRFQLSSSTKLFTDTLMAMLAQEGVVDYSSPIRRYLPDLPESWSDILLEDIMSHSSGLPEVLDCNESEHLEVALRCVYELERPALRRAAFNYNQTNYLLALRVIESVTGESYPDVISRKIFEPVGMSSTILNGNSHDVVQRRATDYYPNGSGGITIREYEFPKFLLTAAGMNATLDDMIAFARAMNADTLLDANWKARMWRAPTLSDGKASPYALGWDLRKLRGNAFSAGHEGGSLTTFRIYPTSRLTVVVLTNGMHKKFGLDGFADVLAQTIDPGILTPPDSAAYRARLTYLTNGLEAMSELIRNQLCKSDLDNHECRELLTWLAEQLTDDGFGDDAKRLVDRFGAQYEL